MHGRLSAVYHDGSPLFAGIPQGFEACDTTRSASPEPLPEWLAPIAWTEDGVLMGVAHRDRRQWGVQFHPESICTDYGRPLLANFRDLTRKPAGAATAGRARPTAMRRPPQHGPDAQPTLEVERRRVDRLYDTEQAFVHLYGDPRNAFWLDSSKVPTSARGSRSWAPPAARSAP